MENFPKPVITNEGGVYKATYKLAVDMNKDGQPAVEMDLVIIVHQKEAIEEAFGKFLAGTGLPDWAKKLLGLL